jgi:general stress protein YciG
MAENSNRGFGSMDDQKQSEIASKGGQNSGGGRQEGNQGSSSNRGLASADQETRERVASEGGKASHEQGTGHEWDSEEAKEARKKGGENSRGGGR